MSRHLTLGFYAPDYIVSFSFVSLGDEINN